MKLGACKKSSRLPFHPPDVPTSDKALKTREKNSRGGSPSRLTRYNEFEEKEVHRPTAAKTVVRSCASCESERKRESV